MKIQSVNYHLVLIKNKLLLVLEIKLLEFGIYILDY
jgi:hypothetical protein